MLETIGTPGFETLSRADTTVLKYLRAMLEIKADPVFYEIGVGVGATTLPAAELLRNRGQMVLFSREKDVAELASDLRARGFVNIDASWGSPSQTYSGYHFELARGFATGALPPVDVAYIDGGHVFHLDAPSACIVKELCTPGGYVIFDDWGWSLAKSPTMNPGKRPATAQEYDPLQIETCHVQLVCRAIMDTDKRFRLVEKKGNSVVYQKTEAT